MLTVHHLVNSRSQRIPWLLEELGLDYEIVVHHRNPETQRSPDSLNAVHPLGKAPTLVDGQLCLVESGAIIEYITRKLAGGRLSVGPESPDFGMYQQWLHFAEGSAMGPLAFDLIYAWTGGGNDTLKGFYEAEILRHQGYMEASLAGQDYFVKSGFTGADINMAWVLEFAECRGRMEGYPRLIGYLQRMRARPAYQRALARTGPQDLRVFS